MVTSVLLKQTARERTQERFKEPVERWRVQKKRKEKTWKTKKKDKKTKSEAQKEELVEQTQRKDCKLSYCEEERRREGTKNGRNSDERPRTGHVLGKSGRLLFLLVLLVQNRLCVNAADEGRIAEKDGDNGKVAAAASSSEREDMSGGNSTKVEAAKRRGQVQNEDRAKLLRCTLLNGSACSTERKNMRRYKRKCDIFFATEHRLRKERPRKDGDLQRMQRELPKERQAVRIVSTHQEEFLWQSTAT